MAKVKGKARTLAGTFEALGQIDQRTLTPYEECQLCNRPPVRATFAPELAEHFTCDICGAPAVHGLMEPAESEVVIGADGREVKVGWHLVNLRCMAHELTT